MHKIAQQLIKIAQEYRASEQDARFSRRRIGIDDYTDFELSKKLLQETTRSAIEKFVTKPEKYSGWAYSKLRQTILNHDSELQKYLSYFGVTNVSGSGYEIHHIDKNGDHLIEQGHCKLYYDIIRTKLEQGDYEIEKEVRNIVIIPSWFHKRCENNRTTHSTPLIDRKSYYVELKNCLLKFQDNRTQKQKKRKKKYQTPIKSLRFNNSDIHSAVKSLEKIALTVTDENKEDMIRNLQKCYNYLKECIIKSMINNDL